MSPATLESPSSIATLGERLVREIGVRFQIYVQTNSFGDEPTWERVSDELTEGIPAFSEILANLEITEAIFLGTPEIDDANGWLTIPVEWDDRQLVAVASEAMEVSADKLRIAQLLSKTLRLEQQVAEHHEENEQFAVQISRDFEELTFLQDMMESLEDAAADANFADVTNSILQRLLPAIEAESLLFLASAEDPNSVVPVEQQTIIIGEEFEVNWPQLLRSYEHDFSNGALVRNRVEDQRFPDLQQFVCAQIQSRSRHFGWLIAANRSGGLVCSLDGTQSEAEFGTYEGSLLTSAASVMATFGLNRELLSRKEKLLIDVVRCLVSAIDAKDDYTRGHSIRVALVARCIADEMGWPTDRREKLYLAGLLHDVGKIGVPDEILKKTGPLDGEEQELIRKHPDFGWTILHQLEDLQHVLPGVVHHHEEFEGTGYPDRLAGHNIPIEGRVIAVADAYDAIVSDRAYRKGRSHDQAIKIIKSGSGTQWDPVVVDAFVASAEKINTLSSEYQHAPAPVRTSSQRTTHEG